MCVLTSAFYSNSKTSTIVNWFCTLCWKSDFTAWWHETNFTGVSITSPTSLSATVCVSQMTSGFCFSLLKRAGLRSGSMMAMVMAVVAGYLVAFWWRKSGQTGRLFVNSLTILQAIYYTRSLNSALLGRPITKHSANQRCCSL